MQIIAAFEAKTHFSKLLLEVEKGEEVTITKHGHPIAKIVPIASPNVFTKDEAIKQLQLFKAKNFLNGLDWKTLRDEGRR